MGLRLCSLTLRGLRLCGLGLSELRMIQGGIGVSLWLRAERCRSWLRRARLGGSYRLRTAARDRVEGRHLGKRRTAISKNGLLSWSWLTWPAGSLNH